MEVAFRIYPLPNGTIYTEDDIKTLEDVEWLFDYCGIMEAMISRKGWDFLIERFGIEGLYEVERKSGLLMSDSFEEFLLDIEYAKEKKCYDNEQDHEAITAFCESTHFPAT